ncbi:MAG: amino acid permease [Deltaproteobacteria bacterium]|nr:amino acid permease [Deltaproteobacteria bacterium]
MAASRRRLGPLTATLLVVANMVGTGVFTTTGFLVRDIPSSPAILVGWLIGGILALCGALSYGELTAALPRNGGEYQLLSRIYHPLLGFVAGFVSLIVGFSAPIAAAALAFGRYLVVLLPGVDGAKPGVVPMVVALSLVVLLSMLHAAHVRVGGGVQNIFTLTKVGLIAVYIVGGLFRGDMSRIVAGATASTVGSATLSPAFAVGLIYISFSYSGWNGAAYLAGEVKRPARTLPMALIFGTILVTVLYAGLNVVFLAAAPRAALAGKVEIGHVAARALFGSGAGDALSAVIALALVSSVSAMVMAGPRVYQAMGDDCPRLRLLSYRSVAGGPVVSIALQGVVALAMILTSTFELLLSYIGFTLSLSAGLTVFGVLVLRRREPVLERPYKSLGYPLTPLLFVALSLWMAGHALFAKPIVGLAGLGTLAVGALLYLVLGPHAGRAVVS